MPFLVKAMILLPVCLFVGAVVAGALYLFSVIGCDKQEVA